MAAAIEWSEKKKIIVTAAIGVAINACAAYYLMTLNTELTQKETQHRALKVEIDNLNKVVSQMPLKELTLANRKAEFSSKEASCRTANASMISSMKFHGWQASGSVSRSA